MQAQSSQGNETQMVEIFVTTKAIDVAEEITAEKIKLEQWPADRIPEGVTSNLEDLSGKFARQRFYAGEPVMPIKLMNDSNGTSQKIPRGFTVVAMKADPENAVANLVRPGDRVDVMAYFRKSEVIPETTAKTILRGVRVFAMDGQTNREDNEDNAKAARTISLLIKKTDAEVWTWAKELGKIRLTLGNLTDYQDGEEAEQDAGKEFLAWIADHANNQIETKTTTTTSVKPKRKKTNSDEFTMTKLSSGRIVEYGWTPGSELPRVVSDSGSDAAPVEEADVIDDSAGQDDYSYLNGAESPFYQPAEGTGTPVDKGQNDELTP